MFKEETNSIFASSSFWLIVVLLVVLACGLGVRLLDLTDPPLEYASTRQLRSALIARGMYYSHAQDVPEWQREIAVDMGQLPMIEPTIIESIVAGTYWIVGGEYVWIARIYTSLFWVLGGAALFFLVREMISIDGAVIALTYYLFNPFGIVVSRSFQPESLMVALIILVWWTFYRWHRTSAWKWALLAGLSAGVAIFVKFTSVFFLLGGMAIVVLMRKKLKENIRDAQMWVIVLLSALPALLYTAYGLFIVGSLGQQFQGRFFPQLWSDPKFYIQWKNALATNSGREFILVAGLIGLFFIKDRVKLGFLLGIWFGYLIYGFSFSYHFMTHRYYHIPVIPLLAVSIGALAEYVFRWVRKFKLENLIRAGLAGIVFIGLGGGYYKLQEKDYRNEPDWYYTVASFVGREAKVVALTQDYGYRINYYGWIKPRIWLGTEDMQHAALQGAEPQPFSEHFVEYVTGYDYFLVTRPNELARQEELHDELYNNYTIYKEGVGYVIFDLKKPSNDYDQSLVSIITPSYNQARFLEATLQSVLQQDYPNMEYIVVDGSSTDGSVEIIKKYADRLAWWVSEPDDGQADAINKGFRRAKGDIVAWLNSDDLYLPGAVNEAVDAFHAHPGAGMVYGDAVSSDAAGRLLNHLPAGDLELTDLLRFQIITQPAVFMRRSALKKVNYLDPSYHFFLDHHLWIRMAREAEIVHQERTWAISRYHEDAKNVYLAEKCGEEAYRILAWAESQPDLAALLQEDSRRIWAGAHKINARYLLDGGRAWPAFTGYLKATATYPPASGHFLHRLLFAGLSLLGGAFLADWYYAWKSRRVPHIETTLPLKGWPGIRLDA